ncbi:MAG: hypothetical protein AAFV88_08695 [Planctomycetota bacterium]
MARKTEDREDLLRDGTAMPQRGRMWIESQEVFVGFRIVGPEHLAASLYWDQDPVYQFNTNGRLRRVFFQGRRYKATNGTLYQLHQTGANRKTTERLVLTDSQVERERQRHMIGQLELCLQQITEYLSNKGDVECVGMAGTAFKNQTLKWIHDLPRPIEIADSPAVTD